MKKTCPSREQLFAVVKGDATADQVDFCESHLSDCEDCIHELEQLSADPDLWGDISLSLRDLPTAGLDETTEATHAPALEMGQLQALLGPTDDPSMLGRIGGYEVVGLLGRGGMGAVFKALDRSLNRYVAIKLLQPHIVTSGAARARFAREAQAAAAVVDDHVMPILTVDSWQGMPYLVMPYYRGCSLQHRISEQGSLGLKEVLRIAMQAARALAAAHEQGIIHRDVKPANIFLDAGVERARLMDFGLARAVDDATLTRSGSITGTPQFMSPEQVRGESLDPRTDLFSLGAVIYAMCTGQAPFRAETSYAVLRRITDREPPPMQEYNPDIPNWLSALVSRLMAKLPAERIQSARETAELLEDCLAHVQRPLDNPLPKLLQTNALHESRRTTSFITGMALSVTAMIVASAACYALRLSLFEAGILGAVLLVTAFALRNQLASLFVGVSTASLSFWRNYSMRCIVAATLVLTLASTSALIPRQNEHSDKREFSTSSVPQSSLHNEEAPVSVQVIVFDTVVPIEHDVQLLQRSTSTAKETRSIIDRLVKEEKATIITERRVESAVGYAMTVPVGNESLRLTVNDMADGLYLSRIEFSRGGSMLIQDLDPATSRDADEKIPTLDVRVSQRLPKLIGPFELPNRKVRFIQLIIEPLSRQENQLANSQSPTLGEQVQQIPTIPADKERRQNIEQRSNESLDPGSTQLNPPAFVSIDMLIVEVGTPLEAEIRPFLKDRTPIGEFRALINRLVAQKKAVVVGESRHPRVPNLGNQIEMTYRDTLNFIIEPRTENCRVTLRMPDVITKVAPDSQSTNVVFDPVFQFDLGYAASEVFGPYEINGSKRVRLVQLTVDQSPSEDHQDGAQQAPRAAAQPPMIPKVPNDNDAVLEAAKQKYAPNTEALKDQSLTPAQRSKKLRDLQYQLNPSRQNAKDLTGQPAPPLSVDRWTDGIENRSLADFLGKVVYIEFSRVGYEPGRTATPSLMKRLAEKYAGEVVFVSITSPATTDEQLRLQIQRDGWPLLWGVDQFADEENFLGKTARAFQVTAYPEFVVLDRAGRVASSSLAEHRRMTPELATQAYEEIAELLDRPWPPTEPIPATEFLEINLKLEELRVEKAIRLAQASTNPAMSEHEQIRTLRLIPGNRVTTGVDKRFPIRVEGKNGFTDERKVRNGETRLFDFPEPVAEARWQCGDYRTEVIDDIEPFSFLLVECLEDKLVMTTYRRAEKKPANVKSNSQSRAAHAAIQSLGLVAGNRITTSVDSRYPIRVDGHPDLLDELLVPHGETRLIQLRDPTREVQWQCGDYKAETIDDIEPFHNVLVEWESHKLVMTTYRSPKKAEGDSAANTSQSKAAIAGLEAKLADVRARAKLLARVVEGTRMQVQQGLADEFRLVERVTKLDQVRKEIAALEYQLANNGLRWSSELGQQIYFNPENRSVTVPEPSQAANSPLSAGMPAPEWKVSRWSDSVERKLSDYRGKVVVLDFWAVWCGPCVAAIPEWKKLQSLYKDREVVFLGLHPAGTEDSEIQRLIQEKQWTIPLGVDGAGDNETDTTIRSLGLSNHGDY